ncbi:MAG: PP2C family protein-serine/threonine phosphatase [Terriglobales bacterium]
MSFTMASDPRQLPQRPNLKTKTARFWQRVTDGLEVHQLWGQLVKDARSSYRFYSIGVGERLEGQSRGQRAWHLFKTLFWAIIEKLSPARRVLLLLGLILLFFSSGISYADKAGEIHVFAFDFRLVGGLLIFVVLLLELADRVVMKRDLEIAKDIQSWLLPGAPLQIPGYSIAYATRPANTVAGDYYDVILRPGPTPDQDRVLFAVADVAGKSIPAAMLMATFQASLRTLATSGSALGEIAVELNRYACSNSQGGARFTTAFLAELNPETGDIAYVNAGHNVPILRRSSGAVYRPEEGGIPIGVLASASYQVGTTSLANGDWLVIFTDGVVEAMNAKGEEYGEPELIRVIDRGAALAPADLLKNLLAALDWFVGNTPQHDDITCLLLKRG